MQAPDGASMGESAKDAEVADIKVNFRLKKPDSEDFWENTITEQLQVQGKVEVALLTTS